SRARSDYPYSAPRFWAEELPRYSARPADSSWPIRSWLSSRAGSLSATRSTRRAVSVGPRCRPWLRNWCSSLAESAGLPCSRTPFLWRSSWASTGSFLRKSSRCSWPPPSPLAGTNSLLRKGEVFLFRVGFGKGTASAVPLKLGKMRALAPKGLGPVVRLIEQDYRIL